MGVPSFFLLKYVSVIGWYWNNWYLCKKFESNMEKDESKIWEKFYGKEVCKEDLKIEGFENPIPFTIYDGHAVCDDFNGHRYDMIYPQMKAISASEELQKAILEYCDDIDDVQEISPLHSLITFNTLYEDGVEVLAEEEAESLANS